MCFVFAMRVFVGRLLDLDGVCLASPSPALPFPMAPNIALPCKSAMRVLMSALLQVDGFMEVGTTLHLKLAKPCNMLVQMVE